MKKRLILNWKTTLIGCLILITGIIALILGKISGVEFIGFVTTALPLLVSKDSLITGLTIGIVKVKSSDEQSGDPPDPPGPGGIISKEKEI